MTRGSSKQAAKSLDQTRDSTPGLSFNQTADIICDLLEVALHTLLCLRAVYPPSTFTRVKAFGVPVYQNRHPGVRQWVAGVVRALGVEMKKGILERVTFVLSSVTTGEPMERYVFEVGYMDLKPFSDESRKDQPIQNTPQLEEMNLITQAFLTRLINLEGQLMPFKDDQELTFNVVIATKSDTQPDTRPVVDYTPYDGKLAPRREARLPGIHVTEGQVTWTPALQGDGHQPRATNRKGKARLTDDVADDSDSSAKRGGNADDDAADEPLVAVRSIETGVIDINLMVQESADKARLMKQLLLRD